MKLEKLKRDNLLENSKEIKSKKNQRTKFKKYYIPEFKLKFKNLSWKKKQYESIYKFHPSKYNLSPRKSAILRKKSIKNNFSHTNLEKHNSLILYSTNTKFKNNLIKEKNKDKKSNSLKIDFLKKKNIKSLLKNNKIEKNDNNYLNKSKEKKIDNINGETTQNIKKEKYLIDNNNNSVNINNKGQSLVRMNNIKKVNNVIYNNSSSKISNNNKNNTRITNKNINMNKYANVENKNNQKEFIDFNKTNKISKVENIFLIEDDKDKNESLDISEYVNKINSIKRYTNRNSANFLRENKYITSAKNINKKSLSNIHFYTKKNYRKFSKRKSTMISFSKKFHEKNDNIFKLDQENKSNINKHQKEKEKTIINEKNNIPLVSNNNNNANKNGNNIEIKTDLNKKNSNSFKYVKNDEFIQKKLLEEINIENKHHGEHKKTYKPFYQTEKELSEDYNKMEEINFLLSKSKYYKKSIKLRQKKISKQGTIININTKQKINEINQESNDKEEEEQEERDVAKKLEEKISMLKFRRRMKRSVTLDYIKQKYKEIEQQKGEVDINEELAENLDKLDSFNNLDLDSDEDIEYGKNILLHKLREEIKYKISVGKFDKSEMDEFLEFENKINDYKRNYNLKDKNKKKEYVLLLLVKFNEFIELLKIREKRKSEENRINKFINNLNYELDYNVPKLLLFKGKKCQSRNYSGYIPSLSELKK